MKFQVKTTALAILVSLGVVACTSNNDSNHNQPTQPTTVKTESSTTDVDKKKAEEAKKSEEAKKAEAERLAAEKAKAEAEAKAKAEEAKRLEEERKKAEAEAKKLTDAKAKAEAEAKAKAAAEAKAKAEAEAKRKAEEAKSLEEERKKAEAEAKRLAEEKAKADAEAKRKAEEAKKLAEEKAKADAEAKRKAEEAKKLAEEKAKADAEAKRKAEEAKRLEEERKRKEAEAAEKNKPVNLLDKNGVEWRIINIQSNGPRNNTTEYRYNGYLNSLRTNFHPGEKSFFDYYGVNGETDLNFNELSAQDGKPFLGVHQGKKEDPDFSGKIVTKVKRNNRAVDFGIIEKEDAKAFNYLYVNQPYSTYGALFTNGHDVKFFSVAQKAEENRSAGYNSTYPVWKEEVVERNGQSIKTGKIIWNDAVAGEATYKGQVIASVTKADIDGDVRFGVRSEPVLDGTVTLKAKFDKDPERNSIEGEINSNLIGKIVLEKNLDQSKTYRRGMATNETMNIKEASWSNDYEVNFYGKDLNDAVGKVDLINRSYKEIGDVIEYNAVFGATKQPK